MKKDIAELKKHIQSVSDKSGGFAAWKQDLISRVENEMCTSIGLDRHDSAHIKEALSHVCDLAFAEGIIFAVEAGE